MTPEARLALAMWQRYGDAKVYLEPREDGNGLWDVWLSERYAIDHVGSSGSRIAHGLSKSVAHALAKTLADTWQNPDPPQEIYPVERFTL